MAKKKKDQVISWGEYKKQNGSTMSYGQYKQNQLKEQERRRREQEAQEKERQRQADEQQQLYDRLNQTIMDRYNPDNYWRNTSQNLKYSNAGDQSWMAYAAKMINDTPGAEEKERVKDLIYQTQQERNKPENYWRNQAQNTKYTQYGDMSWVPYAQKQIYDTPVTEKQIRRAGSEEEAQNRKWNDFLIQQGFMSKPLTPTQQYAELTPEEQGQWLKPQSKKVKRLTSVTAAKDYVRNNPYSMTEVKNAQRYWQNFMKEQQAILDEENRKYQESISGQNQEEKDAEINSKWDEARTVRERNDQYREIAEDLTRYGVELGNGERIKAKPDDYEDYREDYDAALYDELHGKGSYQKRVEAITDDSEVDALEAELDDLWDKLVKGNIVDAYADSFAEEDQLRSEANNIREEKNPAIRKAEAEIRYAQDRLNEIDAQIRFLEPYFNLMGEQPEVTMPEYDPENDRGQTDVYDMDAINRGVITDDVHRIYSFINGGNEYRAWIGNSSPDQWKASGEYSGALFMNADEIEQFNDYYNKGQYKEAKAFFDGLKPYLNERYRPFEQVEHREAAKIVPITSNVMWQVMKQADTYISPMRTLAGWLGDESVKDPYGKWYATNRAENDIETETANRIGGMGGKVYQITMNSVRNILNASQLKGSGLTTKAAQEAASLGMFASQIYQESTYKYLAETHDYTKAQGLALLDAVMETAEEMLPYEAMFRNVPGHWVMNIVRNSLSEAGEELTGATIGEKIKGFITGRDNLEKRADEIIHNGGYYDDDGNWVELDKEDQWKAYAQADARALGEWVNEIKENTLAGLAGGMIGATYQTGLNIENTWEIGKKVNNEGNRTEGKSGQQQIIDLGLGMKEGTQSRGIATELQNKINSGKTPTNYETGKLATTIAEETGAEQAQLVKDTVKRSVTEQLIKKGVEPAQAEELAAIITNSLTEEGKLSIPDRKKLSSNKAAIEVWQSYNSNTMESMVRRSELETEIRKETAQQRSVMDTVTELVNIRPAATSAMAEEIMSAVKEGKDTATAIDILQKRNNAVISEEYAAKMKEILENDAEAQKSRTFIDDAMKIRLAALMGEEQAPKTNLGEESAKTLFDMAAEEAAEADRVRLENNPQIMPGKGEARFNGVAYGTKEWQDQIRQFDKKIRNQMGAVGLIATALGNNVEFINDPTRSMVNGWEIAESGTIVINVATGMNHSMLATLAHEMTHWLEHNSNEGYAKLRRFVIDSLRANGQNVEDMIMQTIRNQERVRAAETEEKGSSSVTSLGISDAVAELVAKGSEEIFTSQKVKEAIRDADPGLYEKIKAHVKNIIARIDAALRDAVGLPSREARALRNVRDQLAEIWLEAREDAINNNNEELNEIAKEAAEKAEFSVQTLPNGQKYVKIDTDQKLFSKLRSSQYLAMARQVILNKFAQEGNNKYKLPDNTGYVTVNRKTADEYAFPAKRAKMSTVDKKVKGKASTEIDNLIQASWRVRPGDPLYPHPSTGHKPKNMKYYAVLFTFNNKKYYTGIINVRVNPDGQFFHDLSQIKEDTRLNGSANANPTTNTVANPPSVTNNYTQNTNKGKIQTSVASEEELNTIKNASGNDSISYAEASRENEITVEQGDKPVDIVNDQGAPVATILPGNTVAATEYSLSSYTELKERQKMTAALKKAGYTKEEIDNWLESLDNIANIIAGDRTRYDFVADRSKKFLKDNGDVYKKTLDASTMCKKTRLYNGTFNLVQHMMPNTILMPEDLIDLFNIMKDMELETPCGICYVQSRRRQLGPYTEEWLKEYKGEYIPTVDEVTTSDGLEKLKTEHPQAYTDFVTAMNKKGVNNPKLVQARTDYRGEIRGMKKSTIKYLKEIGGLRIQSFSDFETVHMLDMMQAVMDMKAVGLTAQAYTKVPDFAWVFGSTGIKINLSLIGKGTGLDANGNLVFDNDEGMNIEQAMKLRNRYSQNVGTILVGINDAHIIAAMGDSRIDFIIPFHKSGWSQNELNKMRTLRGYEDYTESQNEYNITKDENGNTVTVKAENNIDPLSYWDFEQNGEANARKYLEICAKEHIVPKFSQFLVDNGDGTYSLPEGTDQRSTNIRTGYWKTLIDFKMYDNEGIGAPQREVEPDFNMDEAHRILDEYDGSHRELPESRKAAEKYVKQYKAAHPLDSVRTQYSVEQMDNDYMAAVRSGDMVAAQRLVQEAALKAGVYTNKRGRPLKLYHGTMNFGFTVFDTTRSKFKTGAIFTTDNSSVANGYSEFGTDRTSNSRYIEDDGTDKTLIKNAKNVLGQNWRRLNNDDVTKQRERLLEEFKKQAEAENEALNANSDYYPPTEIENEFWNVIAALDYIVGMDEDYFNEDKEYAERYRENYPIMDYHDQWKKLREYYNENNEEYNRLRKEGEKYYKVLLNSYEHSDALIDLKYVYKKLLNQRDMFIMENSNQIASREELQNEIDLWKNKGNYTLYGIPGNNPLIIDANKAHWSSITVPEIGSGTYMTDEIVKWAKANGYTSVVIQNVMDPGVVNEYGDDYIFFNSNQLKSADPVTYDDDGNVIPLSERFNENQEDIRYSVEQYPDMEVERFMMGLNEFHMNTEQERVMLKQFKELKGGMDALQFIINDRGKQIAKLEAKENKTPYERKELIRLRNIQQNDQARLERMQKERIRVTQEKGYAKLMYKAESMMRDLVSGKTAGELQNTVKTMNSELDNLTREMEERSERLKGLAEKEAVLKARALFDRAGLKGIAARLKKDLGSGLSNETIENRLALIALKMQQGEFDKETTMELADDIVGKISKKFDSYILDELRGSTIVLSQTQMKELKAQGRTLADVRADLAGTGIRIATKGSTTLDSKWDELCDMIPSLNRDATDTNMLEELLKVIRSEKQMSANVYGSDENMLEISTKILEAARDLMPSIVKDEKGLKQIRDVLQFVKQISGEARSAAEGMEEITSLVNRLKKTGTAASMTAGRLSGNIQEAIEYFNELAEQSEAAMWKSERIKLIEQLKSENTQNILAEAEKWKSKIERDKTARGMMESNLQLRKKITTNVSRIRNLLINETDQKNIPEHMKSLARLMVRKIAENDLINRKISGIAKKDLLETMRVLNAMEVLDEPFSIDDLKMINDEEAQAMVAEALADLEDGIGFYNATPGKDLIANLQGFRNSLERINDAVTTITNVINAERQLSFLDRRMDVADGAAMVRADMRNSRFKGEWKGRGSKAIGTTKGAVVYGNTTPVYFFKNLMNRGMDLLWKDTEQGENRNGLEIAKAKDYIGELSDRTNYKDWANEKHTVTLGGRKMEITIENMMEIYAIWRREQTTNPEMSNHLAAGGIFIRNEEENKGKLRREHEQQRAVRVSDEEVGAMYDQMTQAQKDFIEGMVSYLSNEMSNLGNEASMRMYGIKKYKESYYFPMKVWDGVKSARSDRGISGTDENRAAHKSWSKRRKHMASNALVIGNFVTDAVNHIVEMINYNTMAPAIENMNKILNFQFTEGDNIINETKRNLRVMFQEAYGREALKYLEQFMKDLNGGTVQDQRTTLRDRALSIFKKNAVAGSLSVALQQPLSYIRAAMMISPKYLAQAISPTYWKGSAEEMRKYSGIAVIKDMGRLDMNMGYSAKDYIAPETKLNLYERISDFLTMAPEKMDQMTWTRMWSAVKLEQHALHPEMDMKSEKFMKLVADRFNEVMRRTQVYDSTLVKSSNMRSNKFTLKMITSFMAEPTLSLNVLADAVRNVKQEGGGANLARAGATFMMSAVMQAAVKAVMSTGRSPDDKKTWMENFMSKWLFYFIGEASPLSLIPGYSDMIDLLMNGELDDDAMGAIGKIVKIRETAQKAISGEGKGWYRDIEDTAGQLAQLFTNIPAKNIMRDARAMYNWVAGGVYANRPTDWNIIRQNAKETIATSDTLIGVMNKWLGEAGYQTTNTGYYKRLYAAIKSGNTKEANDIRNYLLNGKGVKDQKTIDQQIRTLIKQDGSLTYSERISDLRKNGMQDSDIAKWIADEYKKGSISKQDAQKLWMEADPKKTKDDAYFKFEQMEWEQQSGVDVNDTDWFRLNNAIDTGTGYQTANQELKTHGYDDKQIENHAAGRIMDKYNNGEISKTEAQAQLKQYTGLTADEIFWKIDAADYKKATGKDVSGYFYRLTDAVNANKANDIQSAVNDLLKHGITKEKIKNKLSDWRKEYLAADSKGKIKIRDAITKAYKAAGYTAADAQKTIDKWK